MALLYRLLRGLLLISWHMRLLTLLLLPLWRTGGMLPGRRWHSRMHAYIDLLRGVHRWEGCESWLPWGASLVRRPCTQKP